ncbi:curved DNA-binding protein [Purpureocillium lilacinum]|uniref:Curved DNA-binding protein n=1 Tax=Purpureocillium lilacinum TaxID=33203 RepID=A0A179H2S2_PURLI|nr:curved DNA-binding protein [Purpureocillium lilacinum]GJN68803.1 curved DNA-binding protein (42 kDa protein) [Purpureocillium lilacinum]
MSEEKEVVDYSLNNPDTLTKYKTAGQISEKVLAAVSKLCVPGEKIVDICQKGDKLIEEEVAKVYRGKKINKGFSHPTTVSPASYITPYTPLTSDESEAAIEIQPGEPIKIQLGAQIDGFGAIACDTILAQPKDKADEVVSGRPADLILATHYANELLLRLMVPPGLLAQGTDEEKAKAAAQKAPTQARITSLLEKVCEAYDCHLVESTTSWLFDRDEIEGSKKIVLAPAEGTKGEGIPELQEVWGVEMGVSLGSGKVKTLDQRATLHRRTTQTYGLKRPTSRKILSEVQKKFGHFPFSLRQLDDERDAKSGVVECVRGNVFRQYELVGDKDNAPVARLLTTIAITKNGITKLGGPPALDVSKFKTDKKITDEEVLKILEQPLARNTGKKKSKGKKKKPAKKAAPAEESDDDSDDSD